MGGSGKGRGGREEGGREGDLPAEFRGEDRRKKSQVSPYHQATDPGEE